MSKVKKYIIIAIIILIVFLVLYIIEMTSIIFSVFSSADNAMQNETYTPTDIEMEIFPTEVEQYRSYVTKYCKSHNIKISDTSNLSDYVDFVLSIIYAASQGKGTDVMHSIGLPTNTKYPVTVEVDGKTLANEVPNPQDSITFGIEWIIKMFQEYTTSNGGALKLLSPDDIDNIKIIAQSYVFGPDFADWCYQNNKKYSVAVAEEYKKEKATSELDFIDTIFAERMYNVYSKTLENYISYPLSKDFYTIKNSNDDGMIFNVILDKANQIGIGVFSAYDGTIVEVGSDYVIIQHNEKYKTVYRNMIYVSVSEQDTVTTNERIGFVRSDFIFQVLENDLSVNPESYLQKDKSIGVVKND